MIHHTSYHYITTSLHQYIATSPHHHITTDGSAAGGYAKEMSPEWFEAAGKMLLKECASTNVIITTALIPGRKAPVLITQEMVEAMPPGSVTVDLAAEAGGNIGTVFLLLLFVRRSFCLLSSSFFLQCSFFLCFVFVPSSFLSFSFFRLLVFFCLRSWWCALR